MGTAGGGTLASPVGMVLEIDGCISRICGASGAAKMDIYSGRQILAWRSLHLPEIEVALAVRSVDRIAGLLGSGTLRPFRFGAAGAITFPVQLGTLFLFKEAELGSLAAYALSLFVAVQFNFVVSQAFVWGDRRLESMFGRELVDRWLTFHGCIALSLAINFGGFAVAQMFMPDLPAALIGIGSSTLIKFLSLDRLAFRQTLG
jgi:putative flippase GtrA